MRPVDVTTAALRSIEVAAADFVTVCENAFCFILFCCRTFTNPNPDRRIVLDDVSNISTAIVNSLKLGISRCCSFTVNCCRDVFNYLFSNCGSSVRRRPGKFYVRNNFCNLFNDKDFIYTNKFEESIRVVFPVYMYSRVKFVKLSNGECEMNTFVSNSVTTSFMVSLDISSRMALKSL